MIPISILPLIAAFSIFPIWIIEQLIPFPWLVEELVKYFSLILSVKHKSKNAIWFVVLSGFAFGISETVFYQSGGLQTLQQPTVLLRRLFFTVPMHTLTYLIQYFGINKSRPVVFACIIIAILTHFLFNYYIKNIF